MTVEPAPRKGSWRRRLGLIAALVAVVFLGLALVRGWGQVRAYDWNVNWPLLGASCGVLSAFLVASGMGYVWVLEALSPPPRPPRSAIMRIWAISLLGRYVPGSVVMVVGRVEMARDLGVARRTSAAALIYEQAMGLGVAAVGSMIWVLIYGVPGSGWMVVAAIAPPLLLVALHPRVFGPLSRWALTRVRRPELDQLISGPRVALLVGWYALTSVTLGIGVWMSMVALTGQSVGSAPFVGGAFLFAFTVSMLAIVFPSGLGVRDGAFAVALARNVPGGVAVALSVASRLVLTVVEVVVVAAIVLGTRRR